MFDLDAIEERILGCMLEKQRTTPDTYPLTLNSLRLACNQSTNRDPVVDYDEETVHDGLQRLHAKQLTRVAGDHSSRATKYRHLLEDELGISNDEAAVLCVLLLRGDQTPGELKQRTERLHHFGDLSDLDDTLEALLRRGLARRLERRPGEKQVRFRQLLSDGGGVDGEAVDGGPVDAGPVDREQSEGAQAPVAADPAPQSGSGDLMIEVAALREEVARLRAEVAELRAERGQSAADSDY